LLAEHIIDDKVIAGLCHARNRAVEAGPGPAQYGSELIRAQFKGAFPGAHAVDHINRHVEERAVQDEQELLRDARLARAGRPVKEDDLPGRDCSTHAVILAKWAGDDAAGRR
jgi:hypothetical protein